MNEKIRLEMTQTYFDGGVSLHQVAALGSQRPDISEFLRFSSEYEGVPFRALWTFGGLEFVESYSEDFQKIGVDDLTLASCMDADSESIRLVSRKILKSLAEARSLKKVGETQIVSRGMTISLAAAKAFILAALDAKERYQVDEVIPDFYFLFSLILFPGVPEVEALRESEELKINSTYIAWAYHHKYKIYPSYRQIAKLFNVAPSTISRLFESRDEFENMVNLHYHFGEDPSIAPSLKDIYPAL